MTLKFKFDNVEKLTFKAVYEFPSNSQLGSCCHLVFGKAFVY